MKLSREHCSNNRIFLALVSLIFIIEWGLYWRRTSAGSISKIVPELSLNEELIFNEKSLLDKQREIVSLLTELNEKDVKINYLRRENLRRGHLLGSYASVLKKERELKLENKNKESNLTSNVDKKKYTDEETDRKVEQVVRITRKGKEADTKVLVDAEKNEYILSSPGEASSQIDKTLLVDIGILISGSAISGAIASAFGQPILLGYLIGGSVIGPGCLGLIQQFVQVETLAQLGATFLLFGLGCEFSVSNLIRVRRVAICGGLIQITAVIALAMGIGAFAGMSVKSSCFLGCVLAMSSTTMVIKGLMESKETNSPMGKVTIGILVMQDIALALILVIMPVIAEGETLGGMILVVIVKLLGMSLITYMCRWIWPICLGALQRSKSQDLLLLGVVTLCIVMTMVTEKMLNSAEVGAFLSGMLVSTAPKDVATKALHLFEPVRDIFAALFFSSIGMLINPSFLIKEAIPVAIMVCGVIVTKVTEIIEHHSKFKCSKKTDMNFIFRS